MSSRVRFVLRERGLISYKGEEIEESREIDEERKKN